MKTVEDEYIASTMRSMGETGAPRANAVEEIVDGVTRRRVIRRAVKVTGAAAVAGVVFAVLVGGVNLGLPTEGGSSTAAATSTQVAWQDLTGKELGDALGLKGGPTGSTACDSDYWFVEYDDYEGFCLDPAILEDAGITTRFDRDLVKYQIQGFERSPELIELIYLSQEFEDLQSRGPSDLKRRSELWRQIAALHRELADATMEASLGQR